MINSQVTAKDKELLREIVNQLLEKKRVNRGRFFAALQIAYEIARDCSEHTERLKQRNERLTRQNSILRGANCQLAAALSLQIRNAEPSSAIH